MTAALALQEPMVRACAHCLGELEADEVHTVFGDDVCDACFALVPDDAFATTAGDAGLVPEEAERLQGRLL